MYRYGVFCNLRTTTSASSTFATMAGLDHHNHVTITDDERGHKTKADEAVPKELGTKAEFYHVLKGLDSNAYEHIP